MRGRSSVGRALEWHSRGQGFDSPRLHALLGIRVQRVGPEAERGFPGDGMPGCVAGIAQLVEHNLAKVGVAGSSPVSRSDVPVDGVTRVVSSVG